MNEYIYFCRQMVQMVMINSFSRLFLLFLFIVQTACSSPEKPSEVNVAVAANMQAAMMEIKTAFTGETGIEVRFSGGPSGILATQILNGAPFDVFVSADLRFPRFVYDSGRAIREPEVYAKGSLIVCTIHKELALDSGVFSLLRMEKIALANPRSAPYGKAAMEALRKAHLYEQLSDNLVLGEGIGQVNQYILMGAVDGGITARSVVAVKGMENLKWKALDPDLYSPVQQAALLLKQNDGTHNEPASRFYAFLFSAKAKNILRNYGYMVN